jgi:DNA invertase Pin-like site-specific DNA recombinase
MEGGDMKVAIYARVSDDKKKSDGDRRQDVNRQIELLSNYYIAKGTNKAEIEAYCDDGKSAYTEDWNSRPDFKRLFNDARRHHIQEIAMEDMTRFSRRLDIGLPLLKELGNLNVHLISLKEGELEVTSSKGWLQSSMLLMFAEWDSRIKSEKVKSGMQRAKSQGKQVGRHRGTKLDPPLTQEKTAEKKALQG